MNQELLITRIFDAPRERVWKAWTDSDLYWISESVSGSSTNSGL